MADRPSTFALVRAALNAAELDGVHYMSTREIAQQLKRRRQDVVTACRILCKRGEVESWLEYDSEPAYQMLEVLVSPVIGKPPTYSLTRLHGVSRFVQAWRWLGDLRAMRDSAVDYREVVSIAMAWYAVRTHRPWYQCRYRMHDRAVMDTLLRELRNACDSHSWFVDIWSAIQADPERARFNRDLDPTPLIAFEAELLEQLEGLEALDVWSGEFDA